MVIKIDRYKNKDLGSVVPPSSIYS